MQLNVNLAAPSMHTGCCQDMAPTVKALVALIAKITGGNILL